MGFFSSLFGSKSTASSSKHEDIGELRYEGSTYDENSLKFYSTNSKNFWILGVIFISSTSKDSKPSNSEAFKSAYRIILDEYQAFRWYLSGDEKGSRDDFEKFIVTWNAIDGGIRTRSATKWSPNTVEQLAITWFATFDTDKDTFNNKTLPFLEEWITNFRDDKAWTWLGVRE